MATTELSLVRSNMLRQLGYTPYCGAAVCRHCWPRTKFNGNQFECVCGWKSRLEPEFVKQVIIEQSKLMLAAQTKLEEAKPHGRD